MDEEAVAVAIADPRLELLKWWDELPPEVRDLLGVGVLLVLGPFTPEEREEDLRHPGSALRRAIAVEEEDVHDSVARFLMLATAIDFAFVGQSTVEEWLEKARWNLGLADHMEKKGHADFAEKHRQHIESFRLRGQMWQREAERWKALRAQSLSVEAAHLWLMSKPPRLPF